MESTVLGSWPLQLSPPPPRSPPAHHTELAPRAEEPWVLAAPVSELGGWA